MRRAAWVAGLLLAAGVGSASAQARIVFGISGDTATGVLPASGTLRVGAIGYYQLYYGATAARLVLHYDPAKLAVTGIDTPVTGFTTVSLLPGPAGTDTVTGSGLAYQDQGMFSLRVRLQPGVTDGTWLWAEIDTLLVASVGDMTASATSSIGQACHASWLYGDVDHTGRVDSRDALITLSAAVGLPVNGFDVAGVGDVDIDGVANSRDALMMLSWAIGMQPYGAARLGNGAPDGCPGLATASERVVFARSMPGQQSLYQLAPGTTTASAIAGTAALVAQMPRLAADDSSIVYGCKDVYGYDQVCRIFRDGSGLDTVSAPYTNSRGPDWAPDNRTVVYRENGVPVRVDSVGATPVSFAPSYSGEGITVDHTGARAAYASWYTGGGARTVNLDGTGDADVPTGGTFYMTQVRWSPGDSVLAFIDLNAHGIWMVPAAGGAAVRVVPIDEMDGLDWGPDGLLFSGVHTMGRPGLWLLRASGVLERLTAGDDHQPSFRRTP